MSAEVKKLRGGNWKPFLLQFYRLSFLCIIVLLIREHRTRLSIEADAPVTLTEARKIFSSAAQLETDPQKMGLHVLDDKGQRVGYILRTMPVSKSIIGYSGPTDTLIAFSPADKVVATKIRKSPDTFTHVGDVIGDPYFMNTWDGKSWTEVASMNLKKEGIEGVSGATLTSMAVAQSITHRLTRADSATASPPAIRIGLRDVGTVASLALALIISFTNLRGRTWLRRVFQVFVIFYVGFINGDLIAQTLLSGWAATGVAWRIAPAMALLVAAALLVPWTTRRPLYCQWICPHGAAQELVDRIRPKRFRIALPPGLSAGLLWLPPLLIALTIGVTMLVLPMDLASIEPFDAYVFRRAGWATISIAIVGLIASLFIPMAYCKFGCPTGALLEFLRSHGRADHFARRDVVAALLVLLTALLYWQHGNVQALIAGL